MTITHVQLAQVLEVFEKNFASRGELGASVSIWQHGNQLLTHSAGWGERERITPFTDHTLVPFWSATKGLAATCTLHALHAASIPLSERVATIWPEFAANNKQDITLAHVLSHQAGLAALDLEADIFDHAGVIRALEQQEPNWQPGSAHGYHPRTFGFLLDEIVRRVDGTDSLGTYWRQHFADPLGLDIWIGLPDSHDNHIAKLYSGKM